MIAWHVENSYMHLGRVLHFSSPSVNVLHVSFNHDFFCCWTRAHIKEPWPCSISLLLPCLLFLHTNKCRQIKPDISLFSLLYLSQGHIAKHLLLHSHFPFFLFPRVDIFRAHVRFVQPTADVSCVCVDSSKLTASHPTCPLGLSPKPWESCPAHMQGSWKCTEINASRKTLNH